MNSAIIPFAQGIGFAIPIKPAMWIAKQLREHGEIVRPWISINAVDVNPKLVTYYNLPTEKGVVVTNVFSGGEAEKSGLEMADIIIQRGSKSYARQVRSGKESRGIFSVFI